MGYKRNEVIGRKITDFYTEASRKYAEEVIQPAFFRDGVIKEVSFQFVKKNGDVLDVLRRLRNGIPQATFRSGE